MSVHGEFRRYIERLLVDLEGRTDIDAALVRELEVVSQSANENLSKAASAVLGLVERGKLTPSGITYLEVAERKESVDHLIEISRIILGR